MKRKRCLVIYNKSGDRTPRVHIAGTANKLSRGEWRGTEQKEREDEEIEESTEGRRWIWSRSKIESTMYCSKGVTQGHVGFTGDSARDVVAYEVSLSHSR